MKFNSVLLIPQLLALATAGTIKRDNKCSCEVSPLHRRDCGFYGVDESACVNKGCCWGETNVEGAPWCYYPNCAEEQQPVKPSTRIPTRTVTKARAPTSTAPAPVPATEKQCTMDETSRVECGFIGITQGECEAGGCCWEGSETEGIPWCFSPVGQTINIEKPQITIRFLKPEGWDTVNLWAWDNEDNNVYGSVWPGKPIEDLGNGWVTYTFPKGVGYVNIIFNNGEQQTNDIRGITTSSCLKLNYDNVVKTVDCGIDLGMCIVSGEKRVQCGADGISAEECGDLNCCYKELDGYPTCFYPSDATKNDKKGSCNIINPLQRTQCGSEGISKNECAKLGCCYNKLNGAPSCFNHGPNVPTCIVDEDNRQQCGSNGISEFDCQSQGCCYDAGKKQCYKKYAKPSMTSDACSYVVTNLESTKSGISATLDHEGKVCEKFDVDIDKLDFQAKFETDTRLHIHIQPSDIKNYPHNTDMPADAYPFEIENETLNEPEYSYELFEGDDFQLQVKRNDGSVVFDGLSFIFERQYLELSRTIKPGAAIYGFGEVFAPYKRNSQEITHAIWTADNPTPVGQNLYGAHPFYIEIIDGKAYGFFLRNSHGMEFTIKNNIMTIQIIGGNFDMYFFMGPTMEDVTKQYYKVIGAPALLPYWSLGWHHCRYGYENIWVIEEVVQKYRENNIPLDTMWIDIDYMQDHKDFTYDEKKFPVPEMKRFVSELKKNHQYYVNMIDPAIGNDSLYPTFKRGMEKDIFVKDKNDKLFLGRVWPDNLDAAFPDWHHPNIVDYWANEIKIFKDMAMTDGHWIDMNEGANFCNGACETTDVDDPGFVMGQFNPRVPPLAISNFGTYDKHPLKYKTLDMDVKYYGGLIEYDIHNIYGHMEAMVTFKSLLKIDPEKRPFLLSRSTFPGTGKYAAHWLGDNFSTWEHLYYSIPSMLNFQFFGIPMVGSDTCGFVGNSNEELCARWMEVGAFNPFGRNHNGLEYGGVRVVDQEPYIWPKTAEASRRALAIRYKILPYMYTNLVRTHTHSEMFLYSFAALWPADPKALPIDKQFLVGKAILITPVITQGATSVTGYFPEGVWYDWYTHESFSGPMTKTLPAELVHIPVHIRGGFIIPTQGPALTVYENRQKPFELIVALDAEQKASGRLYLDDGISYNVDGQSSEIEYVAENNTLSAKGTYNYNEEQKLEKITILGTKASSVKVNGSEVQFENGNNKITVEVDISMNEDFTLTWE